MWVGACFHTMVIANSDKESSVPLPVSSWLLEMPSLLVCSSHMCRHAFFHLSMHTEDKLGFLMAEATSLTLDILSNSPPAPSSSIRSVQISALYSI